MRRSYCILRAFVIAAAFLLLFQEAPYAEGEPTQNIRVEVVFAKDGARVPFFMKGSDEEFLRQILVIRDGLYAKVFLGKRSEEIDYFKSYLITKGYISGDKGKEIKGVNVSLKITAHVVASRIKLAVAPLITCFTAEGEESFELDSLSVSGVVKSGKVFKITPDSAEEKFYSHLLKNKKGEELIVKLIPSFLEYGSAVE